MECDDIVAEAAESTADLTVSALVHGDAPVLTVTFVHAFERQFAWSVFEMDTIVTNHLLVKWFEARVYFTFVDLGFDKFRMGHAIREITIVGEEDESGTIAVQTADRL